jgi:Ca2+-binding EF-hand superfamily protein
MAGEKELRSFFSMVDRDKSNAINSDELQSALSNGTWNPFNIETVNLFLFY